MTEVTIAPVFPDVAAPLPPDAIPQSARRASEEIRAGRLSSEQSADLISHFEALGIDPARIAAAAKASGAPYTPDPRNPAEKNFDAMAGATPTTEDAYRINWRTTDMTEPNLAGAARTWLHSNMFPADGDPQGPALVDEALDTLATTKAMTPDELTNWTAQQDATLESIARKNGTTATGMRNTVKLMLDVPGDFATAIRDKPLSATFVVNAWFQARRIVARAGLRS